MNIKQVERVLQKQAKLVEKDIAQAATNNDSNKAPEQQVAELIAVPRRIR